MFRENSLRSRKSQQVVSVFISSGLPIFLEGMSLYLENDPQIRVLGSAGSLCDAIAQIEQLRPHVVILEIAKMSSDGVLDAIYRLRARDGRARIVVLSAAETSLPSAPFYAAGATNVFLQKLSVA